MSDRVKAEVRRENEKRRHSVRRLGYPEFAETISELNIGGGAAIRVLLVHFAGERHWGTVSSR